ncbi:MAG: hypothetical protein KGI70_00865 [Patescibacteria group bacterium]|nr:hypothetical protein [Patescibacteria group bacterium]
MQTRSMVLWGAFIGSAIGGYIPSLWGASVFSFSSLLLGAIGAVLGIWLGYRFAQNF